MEDGLCCCCARARVQRKHIPVCHMLIVFFIKHIIQTSFVNALLMYHTGAASLVGWLAGRLAGEFWLAGWPAGGPTGWLACCLAA